MEIATDKVDSEVPSPVGGIIQKILFKENEVVAVGKAVAVIETEVAAGASTQPSAPTITKTGKTSTAPKVEIKAPVVQGAFQTAAAGSIRRWS